MKLYIASLKEQVDVLEHERHVLYMNPRFNGLSEFTRYPEPSAKQHIRETAQTYERVIAGLKDLMAVFSRSAPKKKEIISFVKSYLAVTVPRFFTPDEVVDDVFF